MKPYRTKEADETQRKIVAELAKLTRLSPRYGVAIGEGWLFHVVDHGPAKGIPRLPFSVGAFVDYEQAQAEADKLNRKAEKKAGRQGRKKGGPR